MGNKEFDLANHLQKPNTCLFRQVTNPYHVNTIPFIVGVTEPTHRHKQTKKETL